MFNGAENVVVRELFGEEDTTSALRRHRREALSEAAQRAAGEKEIPEVLVVAVKKGTADEVCPEVRASGTYTWMFGGDSACPRWRSKFHDFTVCFNDKEACWELQNEKGLPLARSQGMLRNASFTKPPHAVSWRPAFAPHLNRFRLSVKGERHPSARVVGNSAKRQQAFCRALGLRSNARRTESEMDEMANRIQNFCVLRIGPLQRLLYFKIVVKRTRHFVRSVRRIQQLFRTWRGARDLHLSHLFGTWCREDAAERERLYLLSRRTITMKAKEKTQEVTLKLAQLDSVTDLQRKVALVELYAKNIRRERRLYRREGKFAPGTLDRVLPVEGGTEGKALYDARAVLAGLQQVWQRLRAVALCHMDEDSDAAGSPQSPLSAVRSPDSATSFSAVHYSEHPWHWSLRYLDWAPPAPPPGRAGRAVVEPSSVPALLAPPMRRGTVRFGVSSRTSTAPTHSAHIIVESPTHRFTSSPPGSCGPSPPVSLPGSRAASPSSQRSRQASFHTLPHPASMNGFPEPVSLPMARGRKGRQTSQEAKPFKQTDSGPSEGLTPERTSPAASGDDPLETVGMPEPDGSIFFDDDEGAARGGLAPASPSGTASARAARFARLRVNAEAPLPLRTKSEPAIFAGRPLSKTPRAASLRTPHAPRPTAATPRAGAFPSAVTPRGATPRASIRPLFEKKRSVSSVSPVWKKQASPRRQRWPELEDV